MPANRDAAWALSWRADPVANAVAKRHYNCQSPDSDQWVKPGACLCFRTIEGGAIWSTSAPFAEYVQHAWAGAWENSTFRNERRDLYLSSDLIRQGIAVTLHYWPDPPDLGMVTMVDASKTRAKRDPGRWLPPRRVRARRLHEGRPVGFPDAASRVP